MAILTLLRFSTIFWYIKIGRIVLYLPCSHYRLLMYKLLSSVNFSLAKRLLFRLNEFLHLSGADLGGAGSSGKKICWKNELMKNLMKIFWNMLKYTFLHENFAVLRSRSKNREIKMHEKKSVFWLRCKSTYKNPVLTIRNNKKMELRCRVGLLSL